MMTNLFSIFDPSTTLNINLNWLSVILLTLLLPIQYWFTNSRMKTMYFTSLKLLHSEFSLLFTRLDGMTLLFLSILIFIMFNNLMGLFPYYFTASSHMSFAMTLALPVWLSIIMYSWFTNTTHTLAHLVPLGTPSALMMFMVCIETISNLIRPLTLSVRLVANMIAGHLLMSLLGQQGNNVSNLILPIIMFIQLLLLTLESAVAIIQSYVFSVLLILYANEA